MDINKAVSIQQQADNDVLQGKKIYSKETLVPMRLPGASDVLNVPGDQVPEYLGRKYRTMTPEETEAYDSAKKLGTLGSASLGLFNVVDTALLGVPSAVIEHKADQKSKLLIGEIDEQSVLPEVGIGASLLLSAGEGLLAKPAKALIKASDSIASKVGLKEAAKVAEGMKEAKIASNLAKDGAGISKSLANSASNIAKKGMVGAKDGIIHGIALASPVASVDIFAGDPKAAGEALLFGAGVGSLAEGVLGGTMAGVKSIFDVFDGVKSSASKLIEKTYGINKEGSEAILAGAGDDILAKIQSDANLEHLGNVKRMGETLESLGLPPTFLPSEAVFTKESDLARAARAEKNGLPFTEETPLQDQRQLVEQAAERAIREKVLPRQEAYGKALKTVEGEFFKGAEGLSKKTEATKEGIAGGIESTEELAGKTIEDATSKLGSMTKEEVSKRIEDSFLAKANQDILPLRRAMEESDSVISQVPLRTRGSLDFELVPDELKPIIETNIKKANLDPFELDNAGRPNTRHIEQGKAALKKLGYDYDNGILSKTGEKVDATSASIVKAKEDTFNLIRDEYFSGKKSPEENSIIKQFANRLNRLDTGEELSALIKEARALREAAYNVQGPHSLNQRKAYSNVIGKLEDLSDTIKNELGHGEYVLTKETALKAYGEVAEKWRPIIKAIDEKYKKASNREIIEVLESGELRDKFLKLFKEGTFERHAILERHFADELALSAALRIKDMTGGGQKSMLSIYKELAKWDKNNLKRAFGEGSEVIEKITAALSSTSEKENVKILEKLLNKADSPEKFADSFLALPKEKRVELFGKDSDKLVKSFEKHVSREDVRKAYSKVQDILKRNEPTGNFDVSKFVKDVSLLSKQEQVRIFGESGKKLIDDINHLFKYVKSTPKVSANDAISQLLHATVTKHGMIVKGIRSVKNIFEIAKVQSEKDAIIRAALNTEKEYQIKNAAKAIQRSQGAIDHVKKWANESVAGGKYNPSKLAIPFIVESQKKPVEEEYRENMRAIEKISSGSETAINSMAERSDAFSLIPSIRTEFLNSSSAALEALKVLGSKQLPIKKNSFFKMPEIKPSTNQMIQFNNQMKVFKNPFKIVEDLSNGIVSQESLKIASIVYPATTERIKKAISDSVFSSKDLEINYQDRLKLSMFLGTDLDGSMQHVAIFNENGAVTHEQELNQAVKQVKLSGDMTSPANQIGEA